MMEEVVLDLGDNDPFRPFFFLSMAADVDVVDDDGLVVVLSEDDATV